jgi:hypothetical protein
MEQRILFKKGEQRKFLDMVILNLNCISLRGILQFGFNINYSTLKNYYIERRLMSSSLFSDLCHISKIDVKTLRFKFVDYNFGQIKGGKNRWKKK